jgi:hypothetical protein
MRLSDEMRNLTDHLREAHEARAAAEGARLAEAGEATRARAAAEGARVAEAAQAARQRARDVDSLRASTASAPTWRPSSSPASEATGSPRSP